MSSNPVNLLYSDLQWLPRPPLDFSERIKSLAASRAPIGSEVQAAASCALNLNQLTRLAKVIYNASQVSRDSLFPLVPFRLGILSNSNVDLIIPALVSSAARYGILLEVIVPPYNQVAQQALDPNALINSRCPDATLFAIDHRALPLQTSPGDAKKADNTVTMTMAYLTSLIDAIRAHSNTVCIAQNYPPPVENLFGSLDRILPGTMRSLIDAVNLQLTQYISDSGVILLDVAGLAECVGLSNWHAHDHWNTAKQAFSCDLIPLYAEHVARTIAALRGKSRKVLVLDLDNTIWGGVIGDDGMEGIRVAQGDAQGEAHLSVQQLALDLRGRGVVLAVSSKNTDAIAREPFEKHPDMLLRLGDFAVFQANWNDKATNLKAISAELNLGLDSLVLLDDNPVERDLVRKFLPQVAVPELPEDPAYYARTLSAAGYFETVVFTDDDLKRASRYEQNATRALLEHTVGGIDEYLTALNMTVTISPFDVPGRARIVQLINKSNQYNLTTRRYTGPEIDAIIADPTILSMQIRLADKFGDNGMISVVICRPSCEGKVWDIDTWLMSCRVLGRHVENTVLAELIRQANAVGIETLNGIYRPTSKNAMVSDHYARLGFSKMHEDDDRSTHWQLHLCDADAVLPPVQLISHI